MANGDNSVELKDMTSIRVASAEDTVSPKESQDLRQQRRLLLSYAQNNDIQGMRRHFQVYDTCDPNVIDYQGRTALNIAVSKNYEDVVDFLLTHSAICLKDAELVAAEEGNIAMLEKLLDWREAKMQDGYKAETYESAVFPRHMTPLMLACINENYEMVKMMLARGDTLKIVPVREYRKYNNDGFGETLELGLARIDSYRAACSATYMCLWNDDPILAAFFLSNKADEFAYEDPVFKTEYVALGKHCRNIAVGFLDNCRTTDEVSLLLSQPHDILHDVTHVGRYPRLRLALDYEQKEFVSHKNCQQVLQSLWTQHHPDVMWMSYLRLLAHFVPRILVLPFVYALYFFFPYAPIYRTWSSPIMRFIGDTVSYVVFLALLVTTVARGRERAGMRLPDLQGGIDVVIWLMVASRLWNQLRVALHSGLRVYARYWWLLYVAVMDICFLASFLARLAACIESRIQKSGYRNEDRRFWRWNDPVLVSEAFYCIGIVMAFGQLLYVFQMSQVLGPLLQSLSLMVGDVLQWFVIYIVVLVGFATGLHRLYIHYDGMRHVTEDGVTEQSDAFSTWLAAVNTLFWSMLGYGDVEWVDVIVDNRCGNLTATCTDITKHRFTEGVGYFLYGMYHVVIVIILLNMLIAMMSNSLTQIQENADREWKYARSVVWMQYLESARLLPSPLNILPNVRNLVDLGAWILAACRFPLGAGARCSVERCCYVKRASDTEDNEHFKQKYKELLDNLIRRYLSKLERSENAATVTTEHLEQLKLDIAKEMCRTAL